MGEVIPPINRVCFGSIALIDGPIVAAKRRCGQPVAGSGQSSQKKPFRSGRVRGCTNHRWTCNPPERADSDPWHISPFKARSQELASIQVDACHTGMVVTPGTPSATLSATRSQAESSATGKDRRLRIPGAAKNFMNREAGVSTVQVRTSMRRGRVWGRQRRRGRGDRRRWQR